MRETEDQRYKARGQPHHSFRQNSVHPTSWSVPSSGITGNPSHQQHRSRNAHRQQRRLQRPQLRDGPRAAREDGESRGGADTRGVGAGGVADQRQPANRGLQVIIISEPSAEPARRAHTDRSTPARNRSSTAHNDTPRHADARPISLHTEEIMSRPGGGPGTNRVQTAAPDATQR